MKDPTHKATRRQVARAKLIASLLLLPNPHAPFSLRELSQWDILSKSSIARLLSQDCPSFLKKVGTQGKHALLKRASIEDFRDYVHEVPAEQTVPQSSHWDSSNVINTIGSTVHIASVPRNRNRVTTQLGRIGARFSSRYEEMTGRPLNLTAREFGMLGQAQRREHYLPAFLESAVDFFFQAHRDPEGAIGGSQADIKPQELDRIARQWQSRGLEIGSFVKALRTIERFYAGTPRYQTEGQKGKP